MEIDREEYLRMVREIEHLKEDVRRLLSIITEFGVKASEVGEWYKRIVRKYIEGEGNNDNNERGNQEGNPKVTAYIL